MRNLSRLSAESLRYHPPMGIAALVVLRSSMKSLPAVLASTSLMISVPAVPVDSSPGEPRVNELGIQLVERFHVFSLANGSLITSVCPPPSVMGYHASE